MKKTDLTTKKVTNKPETGNTRKKKSLIRFSLEYAKETCVSSLLIFLFCIIPLGLMVFVSWMIPVLIPFALIAYSMIVYLVICFICEIMDLSLFRYISLNAEMYAKQLGTVEEYIDTIYNILIKRNRLVKFFIGKYPEIPMKLREEIFYCIAENYPEFRLYLPEMEHSGKWRLLFEEQTEEQTLDPKEMGYHLQFIKYMFLLFFTIWLFKYILTLS
jgi:hypothetical protein